MTALSPTRPGRRKPSGTLAGFILVRLVMMGLVVAVVSAVVFFLMEAAPGDAATQYLGDKATPERLAALRAELGLGDPAWSRYLDWAGATLTGDFGTSLASGREVSDLLAAPGIRTVVLASLAFVGVLVIGIGGGVRAGYRASEPTDRALSTFALIGLSLPEFVTGIALITVFALWLRVLPAVSFVPSSGNILERPDILILPRSRCRWWRAAMCSGSCVVWSFRSPTGPMWKRPGWTGSARHASCSSMYCPKRSGRRSPQSW